MRTIIDDDMLCPTIPKECYASYDGWCDPGPLSSFDCNLNAVASGYQDIEEVKDYEFGYIHQTAKVTSFWVEHLPLLQKLKYVRIKGIVSLPLIEALSQIPSIEKLDIRSYSSPTIDPLLRLKNLSHLFLWYSKAELDYSRLAELPNLRVLTLAFPAKIKDIDAISAFKDSALRSLFLSFSSVTGAGAVTTMQPLQHLKKLEYLLFGNIKAKDKSLAFLEQMPNLKSLCTMDNIKQWNVRN
jgi:hypothetical protein